MKIAGFRKSSPHIVSFVLKVIGAQILKHKAKEENIYCT